MNIQSNINKTIGSIGVGTNIYKMQQEKRLQALKQLEEKQRKANEAAEKQKQAKKEQRRKMKIGKAAEFLAQKDQYGVSIKERPQAIRDKVIEQIGPKLPKYAYKEALK